MNELKSGRNANVVAMFVEQVNGAPRYTVGEIASFHRISRTRVIDICISARVPPRKKGGKGNHWRRGLAERVRFERTAPSDAAS